MPDSIEARLARLEERIESFLDRSDEHDSKESDDRERIIEKLDALELQVARLTWIWQAVQYVAGAAVTLFGLIPGVMQLLDWLRAAKH